jgi:hypothetical protein
MRLNVDREPGFYHDESGERFQQLFREAEEKRERNGQTFWKMLTWFAVLTLSFAFWWEVAQSLSR